MAAVRKAFSMASLPASIPYSPKWRNKVFLLWL
jgi:hypothetical protein